MPPKSTVKSYSDLKRSKKPVRKSIRMATDSEVQEAHEKAKQELSLAERRVIAMPDDKESARLLAEAKTEFEKQDKALKQNSIKFTFQAIGAKSMERLKDGLPATEEQQEKFSKEVEIARSGGTDIQAGQMLPYNPDKFPPALIAASCIDPTFTLAEAEDLWNSADWNESELQLLFSVAMTANSVPSIANLGKD